MKEMWMDVSGFKGLYQVSNLGNVRSITRYKKVLKPMIDKDGYRTVILKNNGFEKHFRVSRLVATAFVPNPLEKPIVNHIDMNRQNDTAENLEWCTTKENVAHSMRHGKYRGSGHVAVAQYEGDRLVRVWGSLCEVEKALKIPAGNISRCLTGERKHAGGFRWMPAPEQVTMEGL